MSRMTSTILTGTVIISMCSLLAGCGKAPDKKGGTTPHPQKNPAANSQGNTGITICEDNLLDLVFIGPKSLPTGAVAPTNSLLGFAVGRANTILRTSDGGATWKRLTPRDPKGPVFEQVCFSSISNGWVVSDSLLLHTTDGGTHWTAANRFPGNFYYFGSGSATASSYYQMQPPTCGNRIYRTTDGGRQWAPLPAPLPRNDYQSQFFLDDLHGWASGRQGGLAFTTDGGVTWNKADIPEGGDLVQIQFVTPNHGWSRPVREHSGGLWMSRDGGRSWQPQDAKVASYWTIQDMQWLDDSNGYLLVIRGADSSVILKTTDGGESWQEQGAFPADVTALSVPEAGKVYAVGGRGRFYVISP